MAKKKKKKQRQSSQYSAPIAEYRKRETSSSKKKKTTSAKTTAKKQTTTSKNSRVQDTAPIRERKTSTYNTDKPISEYRKTTPSKSSSAKKTAQKQTSTSKNSRVQDTAPIRQRETSTYTTPRSSYNQREKVATSTLSRSKNSRVQDIAPVKKKDDDRTWFQKSKAFEDGYQFGDVTKAILGSTTDVVENLASGVMGMGEKLIDMSAYLAPGAYLSRSAEFGGVPDMELYEEMKTEMDKFIENDLYNEQQIARKIISDPMKNRGFDALGHSVFGEKSDSLVQSAGQLGATAGLQALGVPWFLTTGATTFGGEVENALQQGATHEEAGGSALISAGAEILSEKLTGGISFGGKTMDDALVKNLTTRISDKTLRSLTKLGWDATGEGAEEVFSSVASRIGSALYKEESIGELLTSEEAMDEYLESFIGGAVLGGGSSVINAVKSNSAGQDFATGLTNNELKVAQVEINNRIEEREADGQKLSTKEKNKITQDVYRDLEKGYISIDTIESTLGGETYKNYKSITEQRESLEKEFKELENSPNTVGNSKRYDEVQSKLSELKKDTSREQLDTEMYSLLSNDKLLQESYNERSRRGQTFEADLSKYDAKQQEIIKRATESGVLNNTNRTHEFVDMVAKISADKGVLFDFTNNQKLKESGFAMEGKTINGYVKDGNIAVNINSNKALNTIVGHEITHVLEGTELYTELQNAVKQYATTKGEYQARYDAFVKLYKDVDSAVIDNEVTADLVGDYLFTDADFVSRLSVEKPNVFKKIYDEIKYLVKTVTGTKEEKELAKVKKIFENAYKNSANAKTSIKESDFKFSFSGEHALNKNNEQLAKAKEMFEAGKSNEDIRKETGWHQGYDGKWRFEIDDSQMKVYKHGDALFRKNHPGYTRLQELYDKFWDADLTPEETKELNYLDDIYGNEFGRLAKRLEDGNARLEDILEHDVLFANYPMLAKLHVKLKKFSDGTRGYFDSNRAEIALDKDFFKSEYTTSQRDKTLIHEIQHAIQSSEKFARGSNPEYFESQKEELSDWIRGVRENLDLYLKDIKFDEYAKEMMEEIVMSAKASGKNTTEAIADYRKALAEYKANSKYAKEISAIEKQLEDLYKQYDERFGKITDDITPFTLYQNTAGEIEARDTAERLRMTAEERRNTPPKSRLENLEKDNVVFVEDYRYSLSEDSDGKKLSKEQQDYFKDSKVRDENGNLKVMYHGTGDGGFHKFMPDFSDDGQSFFFVDNNTVAKSYSGTHETYTAQTFKTADDFNKFFESVNADEYEVAEENGQFVLYEDGDEIATSDTADGIYEEFRDWTGLGYGSANYKVYLNLKNPLVVDAKNNNWDEVSSEFSQELYDKYQTLTAEEREALTGIAEWEDMSIFRDEVNNAVSKAKLGRTEEYVKHLASAYEKLGGEDVNMYRLFDVAMDDFSDEAIRENSLKYLTTRDYSKRAKEQGYDGVIFKNIVDNGLYASGMERFNASTVAIAFNSNQIKSIDNANPTLDPDIRYSLSEDDYAPIRSEYAPLTEAEANERDAQQGRLQSLKDGDMPPEIDAPYYGENLIEEARPFDKRDIEDVGKRSVKAYMYENPEVKPFFQEEAEIMLRELLDSTKGERSFNDKLYYDTGGEQGWFATKRQTSDEIAYLLDNFKYTYADIERGLKDIIEDHGAENNAVSKRIEFMIDERLREGYTDFTSGYDIPNNPDYIALLENKQITEYNDEAYNRWVESLASTEEFAPVKPQQQAEPVDFSSTVTKDIAPVKGNAKQEAPKVKGTTEQQEIAKILSEEPKTESQRNKRKWAIFKANVFDKGAVFEDLSIKKKNRELMGKWNQTLYSEAMAQRFIGNGNAENNVKSLHSIIEEVGKEGLTGALYEYLYHKHNVDRMTLADRFEGAENKAVFGDSVTAKDSQEIVDQYEFAEPRLMEYAENIYNYNKHLRKMLVEGGVISQETADLWEKMYPHYVPIRRVNDTGLNVNVPLDTGRTGVNAPIKRATGGSADILPLFDTMAMRTMQTYKAIAKNKFGVELKNTLGGETVKAPTTVDELIDSLDAQDELLQEGKNGSKPTFTVFENGERVTFEITEDMYDALKPVSDSSFLSKTIKPLNIASNIHRGLLTEYNPVFLLNNAIKDTQDILINSQHATKTYLKIPEAHKQLITKGYWYNEYMENGGEQNSYFDNESNSFDTGRKGVAKVLDFFPLKAISKANNYIEMIPRLAEYIASREAGRSIEVSMLDSARVTTNFRAGGNLTKFINRNGGTFLNASVQGALQQVRNVREANMNGLKGWANLATKFAIAGVPAFLLNNMLWDDDEDYEELSDYVKQGYYVVGKYGDGKFIRIPKGRTVAVIQEGIRQIGNATTGNDEADLKSYLEFVVSNLAPNNPIENNVLAPIVQAFKNETWYGEELVPSRLQDMPVREQYDESTDMLSRWISEKSPIEISPMKINYLLDQYSGGVGDVVLPMLTPEAKSGADTLGEHLIAPFMDKFTTDSVMKNQNVSDFYSLSDELTKKANMADATEDDILRNKYINSIKSEMGELYNQKREIQNSDRYTNETKYKLVRDVQNKIDILAEDALNEYENIDVSGRYAVVGDKQFISSDTGWRSLNDEQIAKQEKASNLFGISASEYWDNDDDKYVYDWAVKNPEYYQVSRAISDDVFTYWKHNDHMWNNIRADKDENGKSIPGTKKEKIIDYINGITDLDYEEKLVLFKKYYPADDTYNYEIIDYLNSREDISYDEMVTILEELDFEVDEEGNIYW